MVSKLPKEALSTKGLTDISTFTSAKVLALYFSSSWCVACKDITPKLIKMFEEVNKTDNQLQVLFVSGDMSDEDFEEYFKTMPWLAVPFEDDASQDLAEAYKVTSMPTLILIDKNGNVIKDKVHSDFKANASKPLTELFESWKALYPRY